MGDLLDVIATALPQRLCKNFWRKRAASHENGVLSLGGVLVALGLDLSRMQGLLHPSSTNPSLGVCHLR